LPAEHNTVIVKSQDTFYCREEISQTTTALAEKAFMEVNLPMKILL